MILGCSIGGGLGQYATKFDRQLSLLFQCGQAALDLNQLVEDYHVRLLRVDPDGAVLTEDRTGDLLVAFFRNIHVNLLCKR